jgi:APA family basic amino acid/polyamine antiporter
VREDLDDVARPGLVRALGPGMATAIVIGNVIGAGIFLKPGEAAAQAGTVPIALAAWATGGLLSLLGALTIAELALRLPQAGGLYVYLREAFGRPIAFLFGWSEFVFGIPASIGALAAGISWQVGELSGGPLGLWQGAIVSIAIIVALAGINVAGVLWGGRAQVMATFIKCLFLVGLAALPFLLTLAGYQGISAANYASTLPPDAGEEVSLPVRFAGALLAVLWAYSGWHAVAPVAEEVKDPQRNIPLALLGGGVFLTALYMLIVLAYHGTLPLEAIRDAGLGLPQAMTDRLLSPFGRGVAATAVIVISVAALASMTGSLNANLISGPRVGFAMARDGLFPPLLASVHPRFHTPAAAILVQSAMAVALVVASAILVVSFERFRTRTIFDLLTDYVTFIASIFLMLSVASIFPIRRRNLGTPGYQTPLYPWVPLVFVIVSFAFVCYVFIGKPAEAAAGIALTLAGWPVYWWLTRPQLPRTPT